MLPRPLLLIGCFIMAMFAGWTARQAKQRPADASHAAASPAASSTALTMPAGLDDIAARMWLAEHLTDANSEQLKEIAHQLLTVPEPTGRAWRGLFACWFEKDPAAAWAFASTREDPRTQALQEWAAIDPATARAALTNPSSFDWLLLLEGASRKDMASTFRFTDEALAAGADLKNLRFDRNDVVYAGLLDFASQDPDATAAWAEELGIAPADTAGIIFLGRWKKDPAAAQKWLSQQTDQSDALGRLAFFANAVDFYQPALMDFIAHGMTAGNERIETIEHLLKGLAWRDPDFAAKEAARVIPDQSIRANLIGKIASILADTDFNKAWSLLDTLDPSAQRIDRRELPRIEMEFDSEPGFYWPPSDYQNHFTGSDSSFSDEKRSMLYDLMRSDKEEAIRLMESIPSADISNLARGAFSLWLADDSEEAIPWLAEKLGTGAGYDKPYIEWGGLESQLRGLSSEQILPFVESLPPGTVRTMLIAVQAENLAEDDPLAALRYARKMTTSDVPVWRIYMGVAADDASKALKYLEEDSEAPVSAWEVVVGNLSKKVPDEVAQAILTLPSGNQRDGAIQAYLSHIEGLDPENAGALAFSVVDPIKRKFAIEAVLRDVGTDLRLTQDPTTAETLQTQLHEAADIPEAERQHWLARINSECTAP